MIEMFAPLFTQNVDFTVRRTPV